MKPPSLYLNKLTINILWWSGAIGLFLLAHTKIEFLLNLFQNTWLQSIFITPEDLELAVRAVITPVRGIILLYSLVVLAHPIILDTLRPENAQVFQAIKKAWIQSIILFIALCVVFPPGQIGGLAQEYANSSLVMFSRVTTLNYHQRILFPALAHLFFFRGDLFYLAFSLICALMLVFTLRVWFECSQISVPVWQFISLGTLSFIYIQIQSPGYPDVLVHIFILLAFIPGLGTRAKLSLFTLSLATHEGSLFIWFALAFLLFDRKGFPQFLVIGGLYMGIFIYSMDGVLGMLSSRQTGDVSNLAWVMDHPLRALTGIFFGLKALWVIVIAATAYLYSRGRYSEAFQILLILSAGVCMIFLGVDTSRLFSWTFMAVLAGWKTLNHAGEKWKKTLSIALILNLMIPPVNVILLFEPFLAPGLYQSILNLFFAI